MGPTVLADAAGPAAEYAVTLPWFVWLALGSAVVSAVVWLAKSYKASVESQNAQMTALVREVVAAIASNTASLHEVLRALQESPRG